MQIGQEAIDLIIKFEVGGGQRYFEKYLARPSWPGGASGVTIGIGYDLGYDKKFEEDWKPKLAEDDYNRLYRTLGLTGQRAARPDAGSGQ